VAYLAFRILIREGRGAVGAERGEVWRRGWASAKKIIFVPKMISLGAF